MYHSHQYNLQQWHHVPRDVLSTFFQLVLLLIMAVLWKSSLNNNVKKICFFFIYNWSATGLSSACLTRLPSSDTAYCGWMSVGYLANTALNIHYNNGSKVDAGGQDATCSVYNDKGRRNGAAINTHKSRGTKRTGHWLKIQHNRNQQQV